MEGDAWGEGEDDEGWSGEWEAEDEFSSDGMDSFVEEAKDVDQELFVSGMEGKVRPAIELEGAALVFSNGQQELVIGEVSGSFLPLENVFLGQSGELLWPNAQQQDSTRVFSVALADYTVDLYRLHLFSNSSKLSAPTWLSDPVKGHFSLKIHPSKDFQPLFMSHRSDLRVSLPYQGLSYTGGFSLREASVLGESFDGVPGTLNLPASGDKYVRALGKTFVFRPEEIESSLCRVVLYHDQDSIDHPGLRLQYENASQTLRLSRVKGEYVRTPYHSSYFGAYFDPQELLWPMKEDSLYLSVVEASHRVPMLVRSSNYFSEDLLRSAKGPFSFHPLLAVVSYEKETGNDAFSLSDLQARYKWDFQQLLSSMRHLHAARFIDFDTRTGQIRVQEKARHYARVSKEKADYDQFLVASLFPKHSGVLNFSRGELSVRGVERVYLSKDAKTYIKPKEGTLRLRKNKDFTFDGSVHTSSLNYAGRDFTFEYAPFTLNMVHIDSMKVLIQEMPDKEGSKRREVEGSNFLASGQNKVATGAVTETSGILYIDNPFNRAGREEKPSYPRFSSAKDGIVYFDRPSILGGAYDKSIYFEAPPFDIDSINHPDYTRINLQGTFRGGKILPAFEEKLRIMEDLSLGFRHDIPSEGYSVYGRPEAKVSGNIRLDKGGIQHRGRLNYLTGSFHSDKWTLYPDKMKGFVSEGRIRPARYSETDYPEASFRNIAAVWMPEKDHFLLSTQREALRLYEGFAKLRGTLNLRKKGVYASGILKTPLTKTTSRFFFLDPKVFTAREANIEIADSLTQDTPVLRGSELKITYDLSRGMGYLTTEKNSMSSGLEFPFVKIKTSIAEAVWDEKGWEVSMSKPKETPLSESYFYSTQPSMDSLGFQASTAEYDMRQHELRVGGIPYIQVADNHIIPDKREVVVRENSNIDLLKDAVIYMNDEERYHKLVRAEVKIFSRHRFAGKASLQYVNFRQDTFYIDFDRFVFEPLEEDMRALMTTAESTVPEDSVFVTEGFSFHGKIKLRSTSPYIALEGYVKASATHLERTLWVPHVYTTEETVRFDLGKAKSKEKESLHVGWYYDSSSNLYVAFLERKKDEDDQALFSADEGWIGYDTLQVEYQLMPKVETDRQSRWRNLFQKELAPPDEGSDEEHAPHPTWTMSEDRPEGTFQGAIQLLDESKVRADAYALGHWKSDEKAYGMKVMLGLPFKMGKALREEFSNSLKSAAVFSSLPRAYHSQSLDFLTMLPHFVDAEQMALFEESLASTEPYGIHELSKRIADKIFFTEVNLSWSATQRAWFNQDRTLSLGNAYLTDINAQVNGLIEVRPRRYGATRFQCLLLFSFNNWYYFRYENEKLFTLSNNLSYLSIANKKGDFFLVHPAEVEFFHASFNKNTWEEGDP